MEVQGKVILSFRQQRKDGFIMNSKFWKKMNCHKLFAILTLCSSFLIWLYGHNLIWAQEKGYPNQAIKVIVPNAPGGIIDLGARLTSDYVSKELKVPMIVENRPGANGMLGGSMVLKAKPDGYTILVGGDTPLVSGPLQSPNPPYNPFKDFLPICMLGSAPAAYGVYSSSPFKTMGDFIKEAKGNPGKLSCGVTQVGSTTHLSLELLIKYSGADIKVVPYKGPPDAIAALLGKHIDMLVLTYVAFVPYAKSGEARILAVSDSVPGTTVKTLPEEGFSQPGFRACDGFLAFQVSADTPRPIHEKLVLTFERVAQNPEFIAKLDGLGIIRTYKNPAEFQEFMKLKWAVNSEVLEKLGLKKWQGKID
jgi:tripartite-type tricarboxylate transporter receptor subunit TctC